MSIRGIITLVSGLCWIAAAAADPSRDIEARIEYGYYTAEPAVISAALEQLAGLRSRDGQADYLFALGKFRLAELDKREAASEEALTDCVETASSLADASADNAEAYLLAAACSLHLAQAEPLKSIFHERRVTRSLDAARDIDAANPRLALLRAWLYERSFGRDDTLLDLLDQTIVAFRSAASTEGPSWGEAEAQVLRASILLEHGDARGGRDAIEESLLIAPGYKAALNLLNAATRTAR